MDLIKHSQLLPEKPTAADTADWYRLGDSVEKHGRHMKRQAVAAEYNSGREMNSWYLEISITIDAGKQLLGEARKLQLTEVSNGHSDAPQLSQALPTRHAALEYAKAEPEVREVIKEQITLHGKTYTAAEINALTEELSAEAIQGRVAMNDADKLREQLNALTKDSSTKDLEEARKELDALFNSISIVTRNINNLSTKVFTHNDQSAIESVKKALTSSVSNFIAKADQVIAYESESSRDYSGRSSGVEVRILDVTHTD